MPPSSSSSPSPPSPSSTSIPILAVTILGILATAVLLVSYYIFAIKCCLNWRRSDFLRRLISSASGRRRRHYIPPVTHDLAADHRGLDAATIRSLPVIKFSDDKTQHEHTTSSVECSVCLSEFQCNDSLKVLPRCSHGFHIDCIDTWLQFNANCPLCRSEVVSLSSSQGVRDCIVVLAPRHEQQSGDTSVVIDVRDDGVVSEQNNGYSSPKKKQRRRFQKVGSLGDECIDFRTGVKDGEDDMVCVQPIRRSISMDSCNDRQLYIAIQETLRQHAARFQESRGDGEGTSSGGGSGRIRRPLFSFSRSSRSAVLPI